MERWLEMLDEKDETYRACPTPSGKGKGQAEETKEKGDGKRTSGDWDEECVRWKSKRRRGVESVGAQIG